MSDTTEALTVGNRVKLHVRDPAGTVEGTVAGVDTYGTVVIADPKTVITPLTEEEKAALAAKQNDDDYEDNQQNNNDPDAEPPKLQLVLANRITSVERIKDLTTGGSALRSVFPDRLPRKRLFVTDVNTLLGRAVCKRFGGSQDWEVAGTVCANAAPLFQRQEEQKQMEKELMEGTLDDEAAKKIRQLLEVPSAVGSLVPSFRDDPVAFKTAVLHADVVVCTLRDDTADAAAALRILSNTLFDDEKVFVLVSSVLTWAETDKALKAKAAADAKAEKEAIRQERIEAGEDPDDDEEDEDEKEQQEQPEEEELEPPPVFSDSNDHERVPHPRYQHWRLLEQATKFANSESLHTYVLTAGMLYGGGEEPLADLFSAAWHREPLPIVCAPGANVVPTVHVADLAAAIYNCSNAEEVHGNRYMLACDAGNNTSQEIIDALAKALGDPNDAVSLAKRPVGAASRWFDLFSIDLRVEALNFGSLLGDDEWASQDGLVANMTKMANEYRKVHSLPPVRVAVVGPPESGKSSLAKWIAKSYGLEYIDVVEIIRYYSEHRQDVFKRLVAHREKRKVEAERRAAEEEAAEAAENGGGAGGDDSMSAVSGGGSTESGGGALPGRRPGQKKPASGGDDDEDELTDDEWEVSFKVAAPPQAPSRQSGGGGSDYGSDYDAEGGSRPTSSRGGRDSARGDDRYGAGDDDDEEGPKEPVPPEVEAAEDKEEDDDGEDELLATLKDDLRLCNKVLALKNPADGRFIDHAVAVMARYKLMHAAQAKNQGYVLDGFPKTTRQAAFTFSADPDVAASLPEFDEDGKLPEEVLAPVDPADDSGEAAALVEAVDPDLMFEHAIVLDASDSVIVSRASDVGSNSAKRLERAYRRMAFHQTTNARGGKPGVSVQSWLRAILTAADNAPARSVAVLSIDTDVAWPVTGHAAVSQVETFLGQPHVVHPTVAELRSAAAAKAAKDAVEAQEAGAAAAAAEKTQQREEAERQAVAATNNRRLLTCTDEERASAAVCAIPAQRYLTDYISAPLASCVASVARTRPADPLNVLADALYEYESPIVHAKDLLTTKDAVASSRKSRTSSPSAATRN